MTDLQSHVTVDAHGDIVDVDEGGRMDIERMAAIIHDELQDVSCGTCRHTPDMPDMCSGRKCHIRCVEWALSMDEARRIAGLIAETLERPKQ